MATASSRIRTLTTRTLENSHFDSTGQHIGRAQMSLGLLDKIKKIHAPALQHLTEAKRIFSQFGQSPVLARVETALVELRQSRLRPLGWRAFACCGAAEGRGYFPVQQK